MRIETELPDAMVLRELGNRIARTRLEANITQENLAREAGIAKSTLERIEGGRDVRLSSFLRVLRSLNLLEALDRLVPEPMPNPVERSRLEGKRRQRAARPRSDESAQPPGPWSWADGGSAGGE